ncbi:MAG: S41 family peptidase [Bacteroidota bacterium]
MPIVLLALVLLAYVGLLPDWQPSSPDGQFVEATHGVWASRGYGLVVQIDAEGAVLYNISEAGCLEDEMTVSFFADVARLYQRNGDVLHFSFRPENSTRYTFDRLDALPDACATPPGDSPQEVFDYTWGVMAAHYAFFDVYGVDWEARRARFAPQIRPDMTDAELFEVLGAMLEGLDDGHLELYAEVNGEEERWRTGTRSLGPAFRAAFAAQEEVETMGAFQSQWYFGTRETIREEILGGDYETGSGGNVFWGRAGTVGYLNIAGMSGFADNEEASFEEDLAAAHTVMTQALTDLADTEALVIDIALNQGGFDEIGLAIASYFAAEPTLGLTKYAFTAEADTRQSFTVVPRAPSYLKPVYVLTSDITVSAAETFTMHMRALPTVTHVGATTRGALSDILFRPLPNGWVLLLSHEVYLDAEGVLWEGRGVPPEETFPMFDAGLDGHLNALRLLTSRLNNGG